MGARSYFRGYPTVWDEKQNKWLFEESKEPLPGYGGRDFKEHPCKACGEYMEGHEPDACLGNLPGADNACCGHGVRNEAYVRFTNGVVLRGFIVEGGPDRCSS